MSEQEDKVIDIGKDLADAFSQLGPMISELSESLKTIAQNLPRREIVIKGANVPPDQYGAYLSYKKHKQRRKR